MITKIIAHRGASGYAPENTLSSIKKAIDMNSDGIEIDVQLTKDKHIVVFHDEKVDRTTDGTGFIKDLTLSEIKSLDTGSWYCEEFKGERVPTLVEVLNLIKNKNILLNIELKNGMIDYPELEEEVLFLIQKYNMMKNVLLSSFNHNSLIKAKSLNRNIKIGLLYVASLTNPWIYAKNLDAFSLNPYFYSVTSDLISNSNKENIKIIPYTVNDKNHIYRLVSNGVYGIITNYPDKAIKIRNKIIKNRRYF